MTNEQARRIFDAAIARATDADKRARLELAREFFTNPAFAKALSDYTYEVTK